MSYSYIKVDKNLYSQSCLLAASLSFPDLGIHVEDASDSWNVTLFSTEGLVPVSEFLRILNEYALRESLEKRFYAEREAIYKLAFEQD